MRHGETSEGEFENRRPKGPRVQFLTLSLHSTALAQASVEPDLAPCLSKEIVERLRSPHPITLAADCSAREKPEASSSPEGIVSAGERVTYEHDRRPGRMTDCVFGRQAIVERA
jgi:hypothetical protein